VWGDNGRREPLKDKHPRPDEAVVRRLQAPVF